MASKGYVATLLNPLEATVKKALGSVFDYTLDSWRFGPVTHQKRSENVQAYYANSTTPGTPNEEFSIVHGLGVTPYLVLPVLALDQVGAKVVRLTNARAPDNRRVYLSSPDVDSAFTVLIEG